MIAGLERSLPQQLAKVQVRDKVAALVRQNKTQEEVIAAKPTAEFDATVTGATPAIADRFVGQLYQEIKGR